MPTAPTQSAAPAIPSGAKKDFEEAMDTKKQAARDFTTKNYEGAVAKY